LFLQDYSGFTRAAEIQAQGVQNLGQNIAGGIEAYGKKRDEYFKDQKEKQKLIKQNETGIEVALKMFPDLAPDLQPVLDQIRDQNTPLDDRAAIAESVAGLINMGTNQMRYLAEENLKNREMAMREGEFGLSKTQKELELEQFKQSQAEQEQLTEFTARPMLDNVRRQTVEAERRGERPLISSEQLKLAYLKTPREQAQIAATALQGLPKARPVELRDIEFTRDGVATKGTAVFDEKTGTFRLVPIQGAADQAASGLGNLPEPLQKYAKDFEEAGRRHGVAPEILAAISMHETANGTSKAFREKNNAMGISDSSGPVKVGSVAESIERMAGLLGRGINEGTGPYANVKTIQDIARVYAPPGAANDPRGLNQSWANGVAANIERLASQREGAGAARPAGIQPGAPKSTSTKTPTEQAIDEAKLAKLEAEAGAAERATTVEASKAKVKADRLAAIERKYLTDKGEPSELLKNATGLGEGLASTLRFNAPETRANQKELGLELLESDLLEAAKDLKPVSEDEMKQLMSRRPQIGDSPEEWAWFIKRARGILESGQAGQAATPSAAPSIQDRTNKLRSLVPPK
jgi:hypothetical protein